MLALLGEQLSAGITTARLRQRVQRAEMERERRSLAADVHDGLAQDLAVALRELALLAEEGARRRRGGAPAAARLHEAVAAAHRIVRSRLEDLRVTVPLGGLRAAVETTVERFERGGLPVRLTVRGASADVGPGAVAVVSRVLGRRSPTSCITRTRARRPSTCAWRASGWSCSSTTTAAASTPPIAARPRATATSACAIMRERARGRGGECEVGPRPGGGTRVTLRMPVA